MADAGSASHRLVDATVTLLDEGGLAVAGQPVRVSQRRHAFTFGCTGFEAIALANEELIGEDRERVAALYDRWLDSSTSRRCRSTGQGSSNDVGRRTPVVCRPRLAGSSTATWP